MARVRRKAQSADDPENEVFEVMRALAREVAAVGGLEGIADSIAQGSNIAMLREQGGYRDLSALPFNGSALAGFDWEMIADRGIFAARRGNKDVGKPVHDVFAGRLAE